MPEKVFLSSTYKDLVEHRAAVSRALLRESFFPVDMINFTASPEEPLEACLNEVAASKLFIGIYARRYGFRPPCSEISITEQELREAEALDRKCFCFLLAEGHPWPEDADHVDTGENAERLRALKEDVRLRHVIAEFTTPEDLASKVKDALHAWEKGDWKIASLPPERRKLLDDVDRHVKESFERSEAPRPGFFPLELEDCSQDAVASPKAALRRDIHEISRRRRRPIPDLFEEHSGRLLILGRAGGGKTVLLLQLARWLGGRARRAVDRPMPVVLTLAAWRRSDEDLEIFLVREISRSYAMTRNIVLSWLDEGKVVPLLDSLDEVVEGCLAKSVAAINRYLTERPEAKLVVCCRSSVYSNLERLKLLLGLHGAVEICPLDIQRLIGGFERAGAGSLGKALAEDAVLRELARNPLMLALMEKLVAGSNSDALATAPGTSAEKRRQEILDRFAGQLLSRDTDRQRTRRTLAWLASRLKKEGSRLFWIDQIQPTWLASGAQVWVYATISRSLGGALLMLPIVAASPLLFNGRSYPWLLVLGLAAGAFAGCLDAMRLRRALSERPLWSPTARAVVIGTGAFLLFEVIGASWLAGHGRPPAKGLRDGLTYGPWIGLLFGLVFGLRVGWRTGVADTRIGEPLVWYGWSWHGARTGALLGALLPLTFWVVSELLSANVFPAPFWMFAAGLFSLVFGALGGRVGGYLLDPPPTPLPKRKRPRGIWGALRNAGAATLRTVAVASILVVLVLSGAAFLSWLTGGKARLDLLDFLRPFTLAAAFGFTVTLWLRGLDLIQHFTLRLLLSATRPIPWRWVRFLDHAASLGLLRKRGLSYQFFHMEALEYFASLHHSGRKGAPRSWLG